MSKTKARMFNWHRWLGWLVGLQVLLWLLGGLVFSWVPFKTWVKSEDSVRKPSLVLPAGWAQALAQQEAALGLAGTVVQAQAVATAAGPAWRLRRTAPQPALWLRADTATPLPEPDAASVGRFAQQLYTGSAALRGVQRIQTPARRLGIVREMGERSDLWCAQFADGLQTRLYFDARSGEFLAARNEAWVWYDFFWRLHLMDYSGGEDFNHPLIRAASAAGVGLVLTGAVLSLWAARRRWKAARARP